MESETTSDPDFIPSTHVDEENQDIRRSNRQRQPKRFDDYLTYLVSTTEVSDCPITYQDAISSNENEWLEAMNNEINSLAENNTWTLMDLPKNKRAIKTKWVYKTKRDDNGNVIRFKARLVVKGCSQTPGIDFDETYSPVIRYVSIRFLIALAARHEYKIDQMDAITAFLQGDLEEEIYIHQPEGFTDGSNKVCKLQKAMYGLKQSGRQWNKKLNAELKLIGLLRSKADPCVYIKQTNNEVTLILAIYVDDILIFWKNETERTRLKDALSKAFKMKYLGPAKNCVGIRITQDSSGNYYIDQEQYIEEILKRFNMDECNSVLTPSDLNQKLSKSMSPNTQDDEFKNIPYQQLVGALLYLVQGTRPDIAFAVGDVSRFNSCYGKAHWLAVKRIVRYLKGTKHLKLKYTKNCENVGIWGYSDSDWASDIDKRRSCTGYVFILQGAAISWGSRRQPTVALSSSEAEYMALSSTIQEAIWLKQFGEQLGNIFLNGPVSIWCDNMGAIHLAKNDAYQARSKHIDIKHHFIRDNVDNANVKISYTPTDKMVADILTKAVPAAKHKYCVKSMGLN